MTNKTEKKIKSGKIVWVTPDYFIDCDFNPEILKIILQKFDIHWIVLLPTKNARFKESDLNDLKLLTGLTIEFMYSEHRQRDPRRLLYYYKIYKISKKLNAVATYLNCVPDPYLTPVLWLFNKNRTVISAHDGEVNGGFDFKAITQVSFNLAYRFFKHVCMFSPSQAALFRKNFPSAKVHLTNLALKTFGQSNLKRPDDKIVFLSFGVINYSKNIELLIQAACNIYDKGYKNFHISINGRCEDWESYAALIRYPELFSCDIRIIPNSEIANLFNTSHYFVQPYRHMSQSGAMKVAFNYNLPVIASDLPGFSDEIRESVNGYLFQSNNITELEKIMMYVIDNHKANYPLLLNKMEAHTKANYSSEVIAQNYLRMFNDIINGENN